ncbi:unnamed protein product [Linum tenue]|uniref:Uncharacterized protein n=1 Tax=Linum tenue TaxID=586396 RepID=A0AAV0NQR7_9ROSI|nr:unnamed protein product [Linum tenue]
MLEVRRGSKHRRHEK